MGSSHIFWTYSVCFSMFHIFFFSIKLSRIFSKYTRNLVTVSFDFLVVIPSTKELRFQSKLALIGDFLVSLWIVSTGLAGIAMVTFNWCIHSESSQWHFRTKVLVSSGALLLFQFAQSVFLNVVTGCYDKAFGQFEANMPAVNVAENTCWTTQETVYSVQSIRLESSLLLGGLAVLLVIFRVGTDKTLRKKHAQLLKVTNMLPVSDQKIPSNLMQCIIAFPIVDTNDTRF